jgi:hypothetical protein
MTSKIKWERSEEGYCDSKCDRFEIVPLFCGTTRPQYYDLYYNDPFDLSRKKVTSLADTQRSCKEEAEDFLKRKGESK